MHLDTYTKGDIIGIGEHFHSRTFKTIIAEVDVSLLWVDSLTVDRHFTKYMVESLYESILNIRNIMPNNKSWMSFADKFVVLASTDVKRMNNMLSPDRIYLVQEGELTIRARGVKSDAKKIKNLEDEIDEPEVLHALKSPVLRSGTSSTKVNRFAPIVDVLTKSEMILVSRDMRQVTVAVSSAAAVCLTMAWKVSYMIADSWVQNDMKTIVKEKLAKYESKADIREAKTVELSQAMGAQIRPVFTKTLLQLNVISDVPKGTPSMTMMFDLPSSRQATVRFNKILADIPQTKPVAAKIKKHNFMYGGYGQFKTDHQDNIQQDMVTQLRGDDQSAKSWSKGNSRERVANLKLFVGLFSKRTELNTIDHVEYTNDDLRDQISDNLDLMRSIHSGGKKKINNNKSIAKSNPYGITRGSITEFSVAMRISMVNYGDRSVNSACKISKLNKGVDGSSATWLSRQQTKDKSIDGRFMIKGLAKTPDRMNFNQSQTIKNSRIISREISSQFLSKDFVTANDRNQPNGSKRFIDLSIISGHLFQGTTLMSAKSANFKDSHYTSFDFLTPNVRQELDKLEKKTADFKTFMQRKCSDKGVNRIFVHNTTDAD